MARTVFPGHFFMVYGVALTQQAVRGLHKVRRVKNVGKEKTPKGPRPFSKKPKFLIVRESGASDGARTRDLRRDRPAL